MLSLLVSSCYTQQPQGAVQVDWSNPITRRLAFAFIHGVVAFGFCVSGQNIIPYVGATAVPTPIGLGAKSTSTSTRAYVLGNSGISGTSYSLFATGTATSTAVTQSAIDSDNGVSQRYVQFRLNNGKVDLIPFNTSAAVTGQPVFSTALTAAELARGFTMGAAVSATRVAAFQNQQIATATPSSLVSIPSTVNLSIGARITNATGWATGGLGCAYGWSITKSDPEMLSLAANAWQIWKFPARRLWYTTTSGTDVTGAATATLTLAGYAPQITQSANLAVAPDAGSLSITGYAPTVTRSANVNVAPGAGLITLTGYAPTVARTASQSVQPNAGMLTLVGYAPLITQGVDNAPRIYATTIMRITTTNRSADLSSVLNATAPISSAPMNIATIMTAAPTNRTADIGPATLNRTVSFP